MMSLWSVNENFFRAAKINRIAFLIKFDHDIVNKLDELTLS